LVDNAKFGRFLGRRQRWHGDEGHIDEDYPALVKRILDGFDRRQAAKPAP
jgi:hypothetical protein